MAKLGSAMSTNFHRHYSAHFIFIAINFCLIMLIARTYVLWVFCVYNVVSFLIPFIGCNSAKCTKKIINSEKYSKTGNNYDNFMLAFMWIIIY